MQPLWPLLVGFLLLAPPEVPGMDASNESSGAAGRFESVDPAERLAWMRATVARLDRANRLVLDADEAARRDARNRVALEKMAHQKTIPAETMARLLVVANEREQAAIEQLARQFRIRVYSTFRQDRAKFARRRAAWNRVHTLWEAGGKRFEEQDKLIDWLELATARSMPESIAPLPDDPHFTPALESPVLPRTEAIAAAADSTPPLLPWPAPNQTTNRRLDTTPFVPYQPDGTSHSFHRFGPVPGRYPERESPEWTIDPADESGDHEPPARQSNLVVHVSEPLPEPMAPPVPNVSALAAGPTVAGGGLRSAGPPPELPGQPEVVPQSSDRSPGAGPIVVTVRRRPLEEDSDAGASPALPDQPGEAPGGHPPSLPPDSSTQPPEVQINVTELAAHINGYNLGLKAVEEELDKPQKWTARRLGPLVDRVKRLVVSRQDLATIRDVLSDEEKVLVGHLQRPRSIVAQLGSRIFEARTLASGPDFADTEDARRAELRHLDELSRALAAMAAGS